MKIEFLEEIETLSHLTDLQPTLVDSNNNIINEITI